MVCNFLGTKSEMVGDPHRVACQPHCGASSSIFGSVPASPAPRHLGRGSWSQLSFQAPGEGRERQQNVALLANMNVHALSAMGCFSGWLGLMKGKAGEPQVLGEVSMTLTAGCREAGADCSKSRPQVPGHVLHCPTGFTQCSFRDKTVKNTTTDVQSMKLQGGPLPAQGPGSCPAARPWTAQPALKEDQLCTLTSAQSPSWVTWAWSQRLPMGRPFRKTASLNPNPVTACALEKPGSPPSLFLSFLLSFFFRGTP